MDPGPAGSLRRDGPEPERPKASVPPAGRPPELPSPPWIARAARYTLFGSGCALLALIVIALLNIPLRSIDLEPVLGVGFPLVVCLGVLAAMVRILSSVFAESQTRLSEFLLTLAIGGVLTAIFSKWMGARSFDPTARLLRSLGLGTLSFFLLLAGSAWGWGQARRMGVDQPWPRLRLLLYGWLLVVGSLAGLMALFLSIVLVLSGARNDDTVLIWLVTLLLTPLVIPAIATERTR